MSSYGQYGGNPYGEPTNYGQQAPSSGGGGGVPLGGVPAGSASTESQSAVLSNSDFLSRVEGARRDIDTLSANITQIANLHQRSMSSPDSSSSASLEHQVSQTQVLNTRIRDQIKSLEYDAARSGGNVTKDSQIRNLKAQFRNRLEQYQAEEVQYKRRYQEQIARQYRIVNPEATDEEVREAAEANWGDEGVFQTALKSNRTGAATSVLGAVRARHNDIQKIEHTLLELNQLFQDLAEAVVIQEPMVHQVEEQTDHVVKDTHQANKQLDKGVEHLRRARRLKWICLGIVVLVILAIVLFLAIWFGTGQNKPKPAATTTTGTG